MLEDLNNEEKTKIMCNEVAGSRLRTGVMIDGKQLEEVTEYKYLGRLVTSGNDISKETGQRITSNIKVEKIWGA